MQVKQGEKIKLIIEVIVEVSSDEFTDTENIIDEFGSEVNYDFNDTENVKVHSCEIREVSLN